MLCGQRFFRHLRYVPLWHAVCRINEDKLGVKWIPLPMPVHNADIAAIFEEIADLLEIEGDNPFRIRAYRNAARTLRDLGREVTSLLETGEDLTELPGIGTDLAAKIQDIVATGTTSLLGKLRKRVPPALTELLHLPGLGPKRVKALCISNWIFTRSTSYTALPSMAASAPCSALG